MQGNVTAGIADPRTISGCIQIDVRKGPFPHAMLTHDELTSRMTHFLNTQRSPRGAFEDMRIAVVSRLELAVYFVYAAGENEDIDGLMTRYYDYLKGVFFEHRFVMHWGITTKFQLDPSTAAAA